MFSFRGTIGRPFLDLLDLYQRTLNRILWHQIERVLGFSSADQRIFVGQMWLTELFLCTITDYLHRLTASQYLHTKKRVFMFVEIALWNLSTSI